MNGYQDLTTNIENSRNSLRRIARNDEAEFSRESIVRLMEKFVKTVNLMDETILVPCRLLDRAVGDSTDPVFDSSKESTHFGRRKGSSVHEKLNSAELFNLYNMLNNIKTDLLWGRNSEEQPEELCEKQKSSQPTMDMGRAGSSSGSVTPVTAATSANTAAAAAAAVVAATHNATHTNTNTTTTSASETKESSAKGHVRRPSTTSVTSSNSTITLSDTESEISNENDSGIETESNQDTDKVPEKPADKSTELARQYRTHLLGLYRCLEQMTDAANYLTARYQNDVGPV